MTDDELQQAIDEARAMASAEQKLAALERLRKSVLDERRVLRILTVVAIVCAVVGIGLSIWSLGFAHRLDGELQAAEASRADARVSSCLNQNEQQQRSIDANEAQVREVFKSLTSDDDLTGEERAALDRLFANHDAVIEAAFPMRRCDPDGIEAYFDDSDATNPYIEVAK